jgi:hypothetical protein
LLVGETLLREFDPSCVKEHIDIAEYLQHSPHNRLFYHLYSTTDWMVFPPHRCATAIGSPKAYVRAIRAVSHNELLTRPEVLDCL